MNMKALIELIDHHLLPALELQSESPHDPIVVHAYPKPWKLLGAGNYAAVLFHPAYPDVVVKIYAPGREGWEQEKEVYHRLGEHPAYSACYYASEPYLVLKRLKGHTLYDCVLKGIRIPKQVIKEIDEALDYARALGLHPHDIHGKNVMIENGRGKVLDVSDFLEEEECGMWDDLKKAYYRFYLPILYPIAFPIPKAVMNGVRKGYRALRKR